MVGKSTRRQQKRPTDSAGSRGTVSIDVDGFHEIRESVAQSEENTQRAQNAARQPSSDVARPTTTGSARRSKSARLARLDELIRLEAEAEAADKAKSEHPSRWQVMARLKH